MAKGFNKMAKKEEEASEVVTPIVHEARGDFYTSTLAIMVAGRNPLVGLVTAAAVQVGRGGGGQAAACGWWGWMEDHLLTTLTDTREEWRGEVEVAMVRTKGFIRSLYQSFYFS